MYKTTYLSYFLSVSIKAPTTNFITPYDILWERIIMKRLQLLLLLLIAHLDKEHPITEAKTKLVKELDVFQQVVVAGTSVTVLVVVPGFGIIKNLSTRRKNTSDHLLISSLTTGFMLLAVIKACSSLWLVIKGTRHIGTTSEPLMFTC